MLDVQWATFPELKTDRSYLRRPGINDAPELFSLRSSDQVMQYVDREKMYSVEEASAMIEKMHKSFDEGEGISWAISLKEEGKMRGLAGIWRIDRANHRGEIGYMLHPELWNKGYATEAMEEIVRYGFEQIGLHSLEANVNPLNAASIRVIEKLGFVKEAYFRENYYFQGRFLDSMIFSKIKGQ